MRARTTQNRRPAGKSLRVPLALAAPVPTDVFAGTLDELGRVRKELAPCCVAATDALGRMPVGFCGPDCERRVIWRLQ